MTFHDRLSNFLNALDGDGYPMDGLITHFGTHFYQGMFFVQICNSGTNTLVMIYHRGQHTFTKRVFDFIRKEVAFVAPIVTEWNGHPGSSGLSIVIRRPLPTGLMTAITNYYADKRWDKHSPEKTLRYEAYAKWEKSQLDKAGWK